MTLASSNLSPDIMANLKKPSKILSNVLLQKMADDQAKTTPQDQEEVQIEEKPTP